MAQDWKFPTQASMLRAHYQNKSLISFLAPTLNWNHQEPESEKYTPEFEKKSPPTSVSWVVEVNAAITASDTVMERESYEAGVEGMLSVFCSVVNKPPSTDSIDYYFEINLIFLPQ